MLKLLSTGKVGPCEWCGRRTGFVFPVFDRYVRACCGLHAYSIKRQEDVLNHIFKSAADRVKATRARIGHAAQGLAEYALILALIAVVVVVILATLGPAIGNIFSNVVQNL